MSQYPLAAAAPVLYVWEKGRTGHLAWDIKGLYSSYFLDRSEREVLGRELLTMNDGDEVRNVIPRFAVDANQTLERDTALFKGPPTKRLPVPGLNPGPMQMLARQLYRSGRGEKPQQLSYVLDTVRIEDKAGNKTPYVQTRSNCVTHALSLFCAGLSGLRISEDFLLLHPDMAMGPQANDFSRYFRSRKVYDGEQSKMFSGYYYVRNVYQLCMAFNLHHPGDYQPLIKY